MSVAAPPVLRFAPSPNGYLHLGHAYSALVNARRADSLGARLLLRMEDIDGDRCKPEFEAAIIEDLAWLGITFDVEIRRQSEHFSDYQAALQELSARGLLYPCFCTRTEIARAVAGRRDWPRDPDGSPHYPGACKHMEEGDRARRLASGRPAALRLDMGRALASVRPRLNWLEFGEGEEAREILAEPARWGDAVLARRDIPASYHIAVVVDDALQGVTDVVRGQDLFDATSLHRLLQELLGRPHPRYRHHDLVRDQGGDKLSKRTFAKSIRALRKEGVSPQEVRRRFGF
ncbi:MAG TPA: tRNA glutamyl-Q(34) synthetase GluQRS [Beijerinckiaceae bacterium]|nr:tRNA glutamyl-Q(34) synthetase GluQRS [Beijerinckiaceae bacterium]